MPSLPVVTVGGTQIGFLFSGTIVIETLFNLPGLGRGLINALNTGDLPVIQIYVMYFALVASGGELDSRLDVCLA